MRKRKKKKRPADVKRAIEGGQKEKKNFYIILIFIHFLCFCVMSEGETERRMKNEQKEEETGG